MSELYEKSLRKLELDQVVELIKDYIRMVGYDIS